ncbi:MAG: hypothetical protein ACJAZK_001676 [Psychroserpens sp.]|jgi:hypothetical protein|uniref:hypothetical protein n=1 Tax=Psychroserpens sp. TaxID=2020870 RepID=UPI0039E490D7
MSNQYNIKLTFSTVGSLFAEDKNHLLSYLPEKKPTYLNEKLSPYSILHLIKNTANLYNAKRR